MRRLGRARCPRQHTPAGREQNPAVRRWRGARRGAGWRRGRSDRVRDCVQRRCRRGAGELRTEGRAEDGRFGGRDRRGDASRRRTAPGELGQTTGESTRRGGGTGGSPPLHGGAAVLEVRGEAAVRSGGAVGCGAGGDRVAGGGSGHVGAATDRDYGRRCGGARRRGAGAQQPVQRACRF